MGSTLSQRSRSSMFRKAVSNTSPIQGAQTRRILKEEYGWPDNFDKKRWAENRERIQYEVRNRFQAPKMVVSLSPYLPVTIYSVAVSWKSFDK